MRQYVAFLRGMNLGRRRIKNEELCAHFEAMEFTGVSAFLASGNVIFDSSHGVSTEVAERIEDGLRVALGYEVPTYLRTAPEVRAIAQCEPFTEQMRSSGGKVQVALFSDAPVEGTREKVLRLATAEDRLAIHGRELFWLPRGSLLDSDLDLRLIEAELGSMTMRTERTLERIAARFLDDPGPVAERKP